MTRRTELLLSLLCFLLAGQSLHAEKPTRAEIGAVGKAATVFVSSPGRRTGTAFCVHSSGLFLTNHHVVRGHESGEVEVVVDSSLKSQRVLKAAVVRTDEEVDLALLRVQSDEPFPIAPIGTIDGVTELADVFVFGFPLGRALNSDRKSSPVMSVNTGSVSALRRKEGELEFIQIDASVTFGSSGGPVLDDQGRVVGVVVSGIPGQRGLNMAIPVNRVRQFLEAPEIRFEPPSLKADSVSRPVEFRARVTSFLPGTRQPKLRLILESAGRAKREFEMVERDGMFVLETAPVVAVAGEKVAVTVDYERGRISGVMDASEYNIGDRVLDLDTTRRLVLRPRVYAELTDGSTVAGEVSGLKKAEIDLGGETLKLDLRKATEISVSRTDTPGVVTATIVATRDGEEVARDVHRISVQGSKVSPDGWTKLGGDAPFPDFFEGSDKILADEQGLHLIDRNCIRSRNGNFLERDFLFEVIYTTRREEKGEIAFIGLGEGNQYGAYHEPKNVVYMRIHPPNLGDGEVGLSKAPASSVASIGRIGGYGTHRAIIQKKGRVLTLSIDVDNDGPSDDDLTRTIPDITAFAGFLHGKNTHIVLGGGSTFERFRLTEP